MIVDLLAQTGKGLVRWVLHHETTHNDRRCRRGVFDLEDFGTVPFVSKGPVMELMHWQKDERTS